jgi:hypothetical protein
MVGAGSSTRATATRLNLYCVGIAFIDERDVAEIPEQMVKKQQTQAGGTHMPRNGTMGGGALLCSARKAL